MSNRTTIYIKTLRSASSSIQQISDELMCAWPYGMPPQFVNTHADADAALIIANGYEELLTTLPLLIELSDTHVTTILCCDDFGDLEELVQQFDFITLAFDADPSTIAGVAFGVKRHNDQISKCKSETALVKTLHTNLQDDYALLQNDLKLAATVQREFMSTDIQEVHGISFSSLWRPASIVSGDMYDITQLDDDHVSIFIVDSIGHGIAAGMLSMMLSRTLSANRFDSSSGNFTQPSNMLKILNATLLQTTGDNARFATAVYGILNCKTNQFTYAGAGHPSALLSKSDNSSILLESQGPLLGVFDQDDYPQDTIQLSFGDSLLLYTDGFESVFDFASNKENTLPSHIQTMHDFCKAENGNVIQSIAKYLDNTKQAIAEDDITMICMQAKAQNANIRLAA